MQDRILGKAEFSVCEVLSSLLTVHSSCFLKTDIAKDPACHYDGPFGYHTGYPTNKISVTHLHHLLRGAIGHEPIHVLLGPEGVHVVPVDLVPTGQEPNVALKFTFF